jgi:DNA-binding LacI/PurR family transcriptional regulator/anti-anti-sigma regulatory factor
MSKSQGKIRKPNARPTIGYIPATVGNIGQPMLAGIVDAARERDVNMICFPGMPILTTADFSAQSNIAFALVSPESVDGVVSWASMLGNYVSVDELEAFHKRYHPLPMVTIGRTFEGFSSVLMDSYEGMREAVTHLIEVHGHRRLAFIRGPESHVYAQGRYRAYVETLEAHGLPVDPNLVTPAAPWGPDTGREAVRLLLDERGLRPGVDLEAIVSVSEDTLLGALEALEARRVQVPEQVAVVGFDDTVLSQTHVPSITTVASPFYETGHAAAVKLLDVMEGVQVPQETIVPSRLVIRQSCGCLDEVVVKAAVGPVDVQDESFESAVALRRDEILAAMEQAVDPASPGFDWEERLLDSFVGNLKDESSGVFLSTLNWALRQVIIAGAEAADWQGVISALRRQVAPYLDGQELRRAEDLWQQARVMVGEAVQRAEGRRRRQSEEMTRAVREIGTALIATFALDDLADVLADRLPELGIPACYIELYEDPRPYQYPQPAPEWSRLILAYDVARPSGSKRVELEPGGRRFRTLTLAPDGLLPQGRQYSLVLQPLFFQQNQIGFVLFEVGPREGEIYETLSSQLSSALQGALLLQAREEAELSLTMAYTEVEKAYAEVEQQVRERTAELEQEQKESARLQQEVIEAQQRALRELSTPIIPVLEGVIVMPLIGSIDTMRARDVTRSLLAGIREHRARVVILDITGVPILDSGVAAYLNKTVQAARLKGARTIVTGISEAVAETIVDLGIDWSGIETLRDLRTGLRAALGTPHALQTRMPTRNTG